MQELLNALFIIFIYSANQAKPVHYSVRKYSDTSIEFHSWYVLSISDWYLTITDSDRKNKVRTRLAIDSKMSPEFMKVLKDLLNKDFNSWIKIEDESSSNNVGTEVDEKNVKWDVKWADTNDEGTDDTTWAWTNSSAEGKEDNKTEAQNSTRKIPWRAEVEKKKK